MYICIYNCMYIHTIACTYIQLHVHTYNCMYIHTIACTYMHTYVCNSVFPTSVASTYMNAYNVVLVTPVFALQVGESHRLIGTIYLSQGRMTEANKHLRKVSFYSKMCMVQLCATHVHTHVLTYIRMYV